MNSNGREMLQGRHGGAPALAPRAAQVAMAIAPRAARMPAQLRVPARRADATHVSHAATAEAVIEVSDDCGGTAN